MTKQKLVYFIFFHSLNSSRLAGLFHGQEAKRIWMAIPICPFWSVWLETNRAIFNEEDFSMYRLKIFLFFFFAIGGLGLTHAQRTGIVLCLIIIFYWTGCKWGQVGLFVLLPFLSLCLLWVTSTVLLYLKDVHWISPFLLM